jgi:hypothetical protein
MTPHGGPVRALAFAFALSTLLGADTNPPTGAALLKTDLLCSRASQLRRNLNKMRIWPA